MRPQLAVRWCYTYNNPDPPEDISYLQPHVKYAIIGFETAPSTGTPHHQGYCEFHKQLRLTAIKKLIDRPIHWTICSGTPTQNITYCKKSTDYKELGAHRTTCAINPKDKRAQIRKDQYNILKDTKDIATFIDDNIHDIAWAEKALRYIPGRDHSIKILYIHGPTGIGKTTTTYRTLISHNISVYVKPASIAFFEGYQGQQAIIMDEYMSDLTLSTLLQLTNEGAPNIPIKGGSMPNVAEYIIILANVPPSEQYPNVEQPRKDAFIRRLIICEPTPWIHPHDVLMNRQNHQSTLPPPSTETIYNTISNTVIKYIS